jgi:steroid delta-isomerase-like uncharacterized protein
MSEQNKAVAKRFYEAWNTDDFDAFDEILAADYQDHDSQNQFAGTPGPDSAKRSAQMYRVAFSDGRIEVQEQLADGDRVITRWKAVGTHDGELMGMPATGKHVEISGITIDRIDGGKVVEGWTTWDTLGMMQQLGAVPEPAQA